MLLIASTLFAEGSSDTDRLLSMLKSQKKEVIAKNMVLTEKEQKEFWPLFEEYQNELRTMDERALKLVMEYIAASGSMTEQKANEFLEALLNGDKEKAALKRAYVQKFRKVLPPKKTIRYFFLESKLDSVKRLEVFAALPLVY